MPPYICQKCISKLNIAFQFKTQCESSDAKLRQCFEHFNLPSTPDLSGFIELKKDNSNNQNTYRENNDDGPLSSVETSQSLHGEIHSNDIESADSQILQTVEMDSSTEQSLYDIDQNNLLEIKPDFSENKTEERKIVSVDSKQYISFQLPNLLFC